MHSHQNFPNEIHIQQLCRYRSFERICDATYSSDLLTELHLMNDSTNLLMVEALPYSGGHEARRRRHLDLHHEELPHPLRRRRVDADDGGRRLRPVRHQEVEGDQGALDIARRPPSQFSFVI